MSDKLDDLSARELRTRKWSDVRRSKGQDTDIAARTAELAGVEEEYQRLAYQVVDAARRWHFIPSRRPTAEEELTSAVKELLEFEARIGYRFPIDIITD